MFQPELLSTILLAAFASGLIAAALYSRSKLRQIDRRIEQIEAAERGETPPSTAR